MIYVYDRFSGILILSVLSTSSVTAFTFFHIFPDIFIFTFIVCLLKKNIQKPIFRIIIHTFLLFIKYLTIYYIGKKCQFLIQLCSTFSILILYMSEAFNSDGKKWLRYKRQDLPEVLGRFCSDVRCLNRVPKYCSFSAWG